jgi:hypothetical protein
VSLLEKRYEPLNTNSLHFWVYGIAKVFTFPLELSHNVEKNRSTLSVGGFWKTDAPSLICSEPPSLKLGEIGHKRITFSGIQLKIEKSSSNFDLQQKLLR